MKKLILALGIMLLPIMASGQITSNAAGGADSFAIQFQVFDSLGNIISLKATDTLLIWVTYPSGRTAYLDTTDRADARLKFTILPFANDSIYVFGDATTVFDGTPIYGWYTSSITAIGRVGSLWTTPESNGFNLLANPLKTYADSIYATLDSVQKYLDALISTRLAPTTAGRTLQTTTTGLAYINIDSSTGDISAAQIETDAIGSAEIAANAIDSAAIADNAIDSGAMASNSVHSLALSFSAANEIADSTEQRLDLTGKTIGTATNLTTNNDKTGYALTAAEREAIANRVIARKLGTVTAGSSTTTFRASAFTEATNGYWNNNQVYFLNGTAANQIARIDAFDFALDSFVISPALSNAPTVGDSIVVFAILSETAGAGATDWTAAEKNEIRYRLSMTGTQVNPVLTTGGVEVDANAIGASEIASGAMTAAGTEITGGVITTTTNLTTNNDKTNYTLSTAGIDLVWEYDTNLVATATSLGKAVKNTIDTTKAVLAEVRNVDGFNFATTGVIVTTNNDKTNYTLSAAGITALFETDTNTATSATGYGVIIGRLSDTAKAAFTDGHILKAKDTTGTLANYKQTNSITTPILETIANRVIARKLGTVTAGASTTSFRSTTFTEADGYWAKQQGYFLNGTAMIQSFRIDTFIALTDSFVISPALSVAPTVGDSFVVFSILSEAATAGAGGNPTGGYIDSVRFGTGVGAAVFNYFATDTSGTDISIQGATIRAFNKAGTIVARGVTGGTGKVRLNFNPADTIIFQVYGPLGYIWAADDTVFGIVNNATDTNKGYDYSATAPTAGKSATVTLWVRDNDQLPQAGVRVDAFLRQSNLIDSSGSFVTNIVKVDTTDVNGKAEFTCTWSSYYIPATDWSFKAYLPAPALPVTRSVTIPRQTTYVVDFR